MANDVSIQALRSAFGLKKKILVLEGAVNNQILGIILPLILRAEVSRPFNLLNFLAHTAFFISEAGRRILRLVCSI